MAVTNCPGCQKKISDKAKICNHCNLDLSELDADKLASLNRVNLINKTQRINELLFIAMLLFCGGFLFMFGRVLSRVLGNIMSPWSVPLSDLLCI